MAERTAGRNGSWVVFIVLGLFLNTVAIALPSLGWPRYLMMAGGLGLLLTAVLQLQARQGRP